LRFRFRLIVTISLLIALTFGVGGAVLISASFSASLDEEIQAALDSYENVRNTLYLLNSLGEQKDYESLEEVLTRMDGPWQALRLENGERVLYEEAAGNTRTDNLLTAQLPQPEADQCIYGMVEDSYGHGVQIQSLITAGSDQLLLQARFDLSAVYAARQTQQRMYLIIYIVVVLLSILTASALAVVMTSRLDKLTRTVRRISGGDLSTRSNIRTQDEFGQLSRDFDAMAERLQDNIAGMEQEMQRQEAFMGAFAHELKTPMTAIIGYADLLRQDGLDETTRLMAADYIYSEGQRLEKLSFKLLDLLLLKKDEAIMREVSLPQFLQEVEKALGPVMKQKNIRFVCRGDRGKVWLEPDLVKSLVYNLVDNAAKAMDGEGIIAVKGTVIPGGCEILVADNGRGMAQNELSRITEAFYRVDKSRSRQQGGAGLGLALCKQIVQVHNGSIQFASTPGVGTRVTVTLYGRRQDHDET